MEIGWNVWCASFRNKLCSLLSFFILSAKMLLSLFTMASPSTLSRIKLLPKPPSLFSALTTLRRNQLPLKSSFTASSCATLSASKRHADVVVLGIETSCDDTAAAVVCNLRLPFLNYFPCDGLLCRLMVSVCGIGEKRRWDSEPSGVISGTVSYNCTIFSAFHFVLCSSSVRICEYWWNWCWILFYVLFCSSGECWWWISVNLDWLI